MKIPGSIVDAQVERLLEVVNSYHRDYREQVKIKADQEAGEIIRQAHQDARKKMHQVILDTREKTQREVGAAQAKQQTEKKQYQYRCEHRLLKAALDSLQQILVLRWQTEEHRKVWVDNSTDLAYRKLLANTWLIEHPEQWPKAERIQLQERITRQTGQLPSFKLNTDIQAGICIISGGSVIDTTLTGLLVDRARIEAEFLPQYKAQCAVSKQDQREKGNLGE